MINTKLLIYDNASGIVQYEVDLYENIPLELTKQISDVQDPQSRVADFTKTIKVPSTSNNNRIFNQVFDLARFTRNDSGVNYNPDFNVNYKVSAQIIKNEVLQSRGHLQLVNVIKMRDGSYEYELNFVGRVKNLFTDIDGKYMNELDLSALNHLLKYDDVVNSWDNNYASGYVYPLIDYGKVKNLDNFKLSDLYPALFVRYLFDKIFSEAGYTYESSFITDNTVNQVFNKLIMPYSGSTILSLTSDQIEDRSFIMATSGATGYLGGVFTNINPSNNRLCYKVDINADIIKDTSPPGSGGGGYTFPATLDGSYRFKLRAIITLKNTSPLNSVVLFQTVTIRRIRSGVVTAIESRTVSQPFGSINQIKQLDFFIDTGIYNDFLEGDEIDVVFDRPFYQTASNPYIFISNALDIRAGTQLNMYPNPRYNTIENSTVDFNTFGLLPKDLKQSDFIKWLVKMFNLYIEPDKFDDRKLIIEPRNTFYQSSSVLDWTDKVDHSQDIIIKPVGALENKRYQFQYAKDEDSYNKEYQSESEYTYGHRVFEIDNQFVTDTEKIEVGFAPSVLVSNPNNDRVHTTIWNFDNQGNAKDSTAKPRILFYKKETFTDTATPWNLITLQFGTTPIYVYPYAGHYDDIRGPNNDLSWGIPDRLFYNAERVTDNTLFNKYWKTFIQQISDPDSSIVEMQLHLNEVDIYNLSFRSFYQISGQRYILQSISYDLNSDGTAKCEFLKLTNKYSFTTQGATVINGSGNQEINGENAPVYALSSGKSSNVYPTGQQVYDANGFVAGEDNRLTGNGIITNGDDNDLFGNNITVLGSSENNAGADNVTMIGTNGYTSTIDGETVINNSQAPFTARVILTETELDTLHTTPITIIEAPDEYLIQVVDGYAVLRFDTTGYSSHKIYVKNSSENIGEWTATFASGATTSMQTLNMIDQPIQKSLDVILEAAGNLGAGGGDGTIEFVVRYRLIKI